MSTFVIVIISILVIIGIIASIYMLTKSRVPVAKARLVTPGQTPPAMRQPINTLVQAQRVNNTVVNSTGSKTLQAANNRLNSQTAGFINNVKQMQ